jgi:hypothetical protein
MLLHYQKCLKVLVLSFKFVWEIGELSSQIPTILSKSCGPRINLHLSADLHCIHTTLLLVAAKDLRLVLLLGMSHANNAARQLQVATAMNKPGVQSRLLILDRESYFAISEILKESDGGRVDINVMLHLRLFTVNISHMFNYGSRISSSSDKLFKEIIEVEDAILRFRSTSNNWQDYVPLLRLFSAKSSNANSTVFVAIVTFKVSSIA